MRQHLAGRCVACSRVAQPWVLVWLGKAAERADQQQGSQERTQTREAKPGQSEQNGGAGKDRDQRKGRPQIAADVRIGRGQAANQGRHHGAACCY